jgi:hypothetical protein
VPTYPIAQPADNAAAYTYTQPIRDAIAGVNDHQDRITTVEASSVFAPSTLLTETWTGANNSSWPARWAPVPGTGATIDIQSNAGRMLTSATAGSVPQATFSQTIKDGELLYKWQWPSIAGIARINDLRFRAQDATDNNTYVFGTSHAGSGLYRRVSDVSTTLISTAWTPSAGVWYWYRLRFVGSSFSVRWWADGTSEPAEWSLTATDTTYTDGSITIVTSNASTAQAMTTLYDDLHIWDYGSSTTAGGSGHTIQDEGSALTARTGLNFIGTAVSVSDDSANNRTNVTVTGGSSSPMPGVVLLDSFAGASDDAKLTAALTYAAAQTQTPAIMFPDRLVTLTTTRVAFDGMKLIGPPVVGWQNVELSSGGLNPTRVRLNLGVDASSWIVPPGGAGNCYNVAIRDLSFESTNSATQAFHYPVATGTAYAWNFHNLDFQSFKHVFGNPTTPFSATLCSTTGNWNMTTALDTQVTMGGSDNDFWIGGTCNVGPGGSSPLTGSNAGRYLFRLQTGKSNWGGVYITADDNWRALKLEGGTSFQAGNRLRGWRIEGRNANDPCPGALVRCSGGTWYMDGFDLNYAMTNAATFTDSTDLGYIHISGGVVHINGFSIDRATGVAETVPAVYISAGEAIVKCAQRCTKGGAWTGRPRVQQASAGLVLDNDPTVTVI